MRDPFYRDVADNDLEAAGFFFDDSVEPYAGDDVMCTPAEFLRKRIDVGKPAVLVTTGAFAPFHTGHLQMMESAKSAVENKGFRVIGGYIAPDHDQYVSMKTQSYNIFERISSIRRLITPSDWLRVDPWAGVVRQHSVNFTEVYERLNVYLEKYLGHKITVFYVAGEDNAGFVKAFPKTGHIVIVGRPGYNKISNYQSLADERRLFTPGSDQSSSTQLRSLHPQQSTPKELLLRVDSDSEAELRVSRFLAKWFSSISIRTVQSQRERFAEIADRNIISLDPLIPSRFNLAISRNYDFFGSDLLGYIERPGSPSFETQVADIPNGEYTLFDDDIHSGGTIRFAKELLESTGRIRIVDVVSFTRSTRWQEVLDARDFVKDHPGGGLVVVGRRVPYTLPFVDPQARASIRFPIPFSTEIQRALSC